VHQKALAEWNTCQETLMATLMAKLDQLTVSVSTYIYAQTVVETGSHKHKGAVEKINKVVLSGLKHKHNS
jgi:hypothetical protein